MVVRDPWSAGALHCQCDRLRRVSGVFLSLNPGLNPGLTFLLEAVREIF